MVITSLLIQSIIYILTLNENTELKFLILTHLKYIRTKCSKLVPK